jgi:hypothetical protein
MITALSVDPIAAVWSAVMVTQDVEAPAVLYEQRPARHRGSRGMAQERTRVLLLQGKAMLELPQKCLPLRSYPSSTRVTACYALSTRQAACLPAPMAVESSRVPGPRATSL